MENKMLGGRENEIDCNLYIYVAYICVAYPLWKLFFFAVFYQLFHISNLTIHSWPFPRYLLHNTTTGLSLRKEMLLYRA